MISFQVVHYGTYACGNCSLVLHVFCLLAYLYYYLNIKFLSNSDSCLPRLYVMAFTSGLIDARSDSDFSVQIQLNGDVRTSILYNRPGNDYFSNKGDLWDLSFLSFGFSESCIKISEMSIVDSDIELDDWNVETIGTVVGD